ncbi:MAG TPA: TIGR04551 family protein [Kofleriaceae bacterium]|nr:TIGR04551 family protein [Kofleriaceae bacterium]
MSSKVLFGTALLALSSTGLEGIAQAQMTPGGPMGGGGGMGPSTPAGEEKKEGVAEAAPKTPGLLPTTPALPPPKGRRKRWKLFQLDGYYRLRTDWFKNFNLGFFDDPNLGGAPFPRPLACSSLSIGSSAECGTSPTLSSANMRLRLEPTFNLDEGTSVHVQADVYDNLVLGSTPTGMDFSSGYSSTNLPPVGAFTEGQDPAVRGVNSDRDAITVKRAWAEVAVPLGLLKFGRQPNAWGMGIWHNSGGDDPINGTYDYDADYGDTVDRVSFTAGIPGTPLRAMIASDWDTTRLVSNQTNANKGHEGHPFDLDNADDTNGWVGVIDKLDSPQEFRDAVDRGDTAVNYGIYFEYKTQSWDDDLTDFTPGGSFDDSGLKYVPRSYKTYSPDVWAKLGIGPVLLEGEFVAQLGTVKSLQDLTGTAATFNIRKMGGAGRLTWKGVEGKLRLGVESGFATGDSWENAIQGRTNIAGANLLGDPTSCNAQNTCTLTQFMMDRDYKVDMILWRHLYGAVTNAVYAKPFLQYDLTKSIMFKVANITSFAIRPVSTPGNSNVYGTEFDGDLGYNGGRLFAGFSYGVLFPFGALSHPQNMPGGTPFPYGPDANNVTNTGDGATAHTIQIRMVLSF